MNIINGHEYVDLGLPSGLKWATCNVGATSPEEGGDYFAWGEISTKTTYTVENSRTRGRFIGDIVGNKNHDAARAKWGSTWRLPTYAEIEELKKECRWEWTTQGGRNGYRVTGANGNAIFLPAAGGRNGSSLFYLDRLGLYWSGTTESKNAWGAYYLNFSHDHFWDWANREEGYSIRAVSE